MSFTYIYRELPVALEKKSLYKEALAKELKINVSEILNLSVERYSLDCRKKNHPHWSYNLKFELKKRFHFRKSGLVELKNSNNNFQEKEFENTLNLPKDIHIVGAGPAGLWVALHLLKKGYSIHLYEQGKPVEERFKDIRRFFIEKKFNPYSNILFGEGGAGAFSDGKLNTRSKNTFSEIVLKDMVSLGIDESITSFAKPHVGTDKLILMLKKLRSTILQLGGKIHFNTALEDLDISNGKICKILLKNTIDKNTASEWKPCEALILATGHSARDIYYKLFSRGVFLESKGFAMGVRVEHPQKLINTNQLGALVDTKLTGAAEYFLATPTLNNTCSAYSFCMCPGGVLVPCVSENETLATNGMSYSKRNGAYANGAIVCPIEKTKEIFGGLELQRKIEKEAFIVGGKNYSAPAQTIKSFMEHKSDLALPQSTYPCGITPSNTWDWLDKKICESLYEGFLNFDKKISGFIEKGLIVAPETRTSSPIRITRNSDTLESINTKGLFVLGEGAGYAGGIVTSAADGVRLACRAKDLK